LRSALRKGAQSAVPLADRAIGNLQQWLIGTYHGVSKPNSRSISTNSSSGTTAAKHPRPHFKLSLASELGENQPSTIRFVEPRTSIATHWGMLSQPDKQKSARMVFLFLTTVPVRSK
jgi:hypothetical protein